MLNLALIDQLRKNKGLTALKVAEYLSIGDTAYYNKITGYRRFSVEEVIKLSELLNVSIDELIVRKVAK